MTCPDACVTFYNVRTADFSVMLTVEDQTLCEMLEERGEHKTMITPADNPFVVLGSVEMLAWGETKKRMRQARRDELRGLSLLQRTETLSPDLPECLTRSRRPATVQSRCSATTPSAPREKSQRIGEFIQQKRDIYLVQMGINRKNKEILHLAQMAKKEESAVFEANDKIEKLTNICKARTSRCEVVLARARTAAEKATRQRVEKHHTLKTATMSIEVTTAEIERNRDLVDLYRDFKTFMEELAPENVPMMKYFNSPQRLIEALDSVERYDYYLIDLCQEFERRLDRAAGKITEQIDFTDVGVNALARGLEQLGERIPRSLSSIVQFDAVKKSEELDDELDNLSKLIRETYRLCFGKESGRALKSLLKHLEMTLDYYLQEIVKYDQGVVADRQSLRDKERRERQRIYRHELQAQEQQRKMEQSLERARNPVKKKVGRPLLPRSVPIVRSQKEDPAFLQQIRENQRLEQLLYSDLHAE